MTRKALIVSTLGRQFYLFEAANIRALSKVGYEVHGAANLTREDKRRLAEVGIPLHHIDLERSPLSPRNIRGLSQLVKLIREEQIDLVHSHSPVGGVVGRLAARLGGSLHSLYTAHGFHFYKGSPALNWLLYLPIEFLFSTLTDVILTVNMEDEQFARRHLRAKTVVRLPGVGVDTEKFEPVKGGRETKRKELGLDPDSFVYLSIGEMNPGKNHSLTIRAFAELNFPTARLAICGQGRDEESLRALARSLGVDSRVLFLGYRSDIAEVCQAADVYISSSLREGLPLSGVEAMSAGLPMLCSKIRGNTDMVVDGNNGYLFEPTSAQSLTRLMKKIAEDEAGRIAMGEAGRRMSKKFDRSEVESIMTRLYFDLDAVAGRDRGEG